MSTVYSKLLMKRRQLKWFSFEFGWNFRYPLYPEILLCLVLQMVTQPYEVVFWPRKVLVENDDFISYDSF